MPSQSGLGWFQDLETLSPPYTPAEPDATWFVPEVMAAVVESMMDENAKTVLLTGRTTIYEDRVKQIAVAAGLEFDHYGLKPHGTGLTTMAFKLEFIKNLIMLYSPATLHIWEDREPHAEQFTQHFSSPMFSGLETTVHLVDPAGETFLPLDQELELVNSLNNKLPKPLSWKSNCQYTGVILNEESRALLIERFPPIAGWKKYYHHMTVCLGQLPEEREADSRLPTQKEALGKEVTLTVVASGKSEQAFAVKVEGYVSSNEILHVTMCVAPNGHAKDSNLISEWTPCEPFSITGVVEEKILNVYTKQRGPPADKKINTGALVKDFVPREKIRDGVKEVQDWCAENNIEMIEENKDKIIAHLTEKYKPVESC
eukprot:TRINITY_DN4826_c0_g1_i4.p1 TRINITY_DN4826_c0_g1~~TRINITY_DN4826_c0_g1_i4.p1  ORF type:complete len:408 (+),score=94.68 TRINITY_DN4826_c0_g1_i4:112-1224(+)